MRCCGRIKSDKSVVFGYQNIGETFMASSRLVRVCCGTSAWSTDIPHCDNSKITYKKNGGVSYNSKKTESTRVKRTKLTRRYAW